MKQKIVFGAGPIGAVALEFFGFNNVFAFSDNDLSRANTMFHGKNIISPDSLYLIHKYYDVVIAVSCPYTVCIQLKSQSVPFVIFSDWYVYFTDFKSEAMRRRSLYTTLNIDEVRRLSEGVDCIENYQDIKPLECYYTSIVNNQINNEGGYRYNVPFDFESDFYGYLNCLREFAEVEDECETHNPLIHHGESFSKHDTFHDPLASVCISDSLKLETLTVNPLLPCFTVGPYIHYSNEYYKDNKLEEYNKAHKNNLLVFPEHSHTWRDVEFEPKLFVDYVTSEARSFDSLTVCVYHSDISKKWIRAFEEIGAQIVCCGLKIDNNFLRRQKTLINQCSAVITNAIGTFIVYCLYSNKPIKLFKQHIRKEFPVVGRNYESQSPQELTDVLVQDKYQITSEILDVYEPYLGLKNLKTQDEMRAIFDISKRIMIGSGYCITKYAQSVFNTYTELETETSEKGRLQFHLLKEALTIPGQDFDYKERLKKMRERLL